MTQCCLPGHTVEGRFLCPSLWVRISAGLELASYQPILPHSLAQNVMKLHDSGIKYNARIVACELIVTMLANTESSAVCHSGFIYSCLVGKD